MKKKNRKSSGARKNESRERERKWVALQWDTFLALCYDYHSLGLAGEGSNFENASCISCIVSVET